MSKNLTRKSLALGAVVALGASLFAGTPASAAESLTLTSYAGTSTKVLLGTNFALDTLAGGFASQPVISYQLTGTTKAKLDVQSANGSAGAQITRANLAAVGANVVDGKIADVSDPTAVVVTTAASAAGQIKSTSFGLKNTVTETTSITVTAFVDSLPADGKLSTGETKSDSFTITFVKPSEVTATTVLDAVNTGVVGALKAKVTLGDINIAQMSAASEVTVAFKRNGAQITVGDDAVSALYVKADNALVASSSSITPTANQVFTAKATVGGLASGNSAIAGAEATSVNITSVGDVESVLSADIRDSGVNTYAVRTGAKSMSVYAAVVYTDSNSVTGLDAPAGVKARVTIAEGGANLTSTITAGGKTLSSASTTDTAESITFETVTNADGEVVVPITSSAGTKDDRIDVSIDVLGTSAWIVAAPSTRYTWTDAAISANVVRVDAFGAGAVIGVKKGGSYSVAYKITDDFGAPIADSNVKANKRAVRITASGLAGVAIDQTVAVSNGVASFTVPDTATATGTYTLTAQLQQRNSGDTAWETTGAAAVTAAVHVQTETAVGYLSLSKSGAAPSLTYDKFVPAGSTLDLASNLNTAFGVLPITVNNVGVANAQTGLVTVSGTALATDGSAAKGVAVTLSGKGLQFVAESNGVADKAFAFESIVVYTDATGGYSAKVYSHTAGDVVISAVAGSITKTTTPKFLAAAATKVATVTITAPAYAQVGQSVSLSVRYTDKFGNPVTTTGVTQTNSITVSGSGIAGTIAANSDAEGFIKFYQLLGTGDSGSFTVTAKYDADGTDTTAAGMTKTAIVQIGATPVAGAAARVAGSTKRFFVSVDNNTGAKNVVIKVAGKTFKTLKGSTAATQKYVVAAPKGSHKVTVYVGGKLIATKTISVK